MEIEGLNRIESFVMSQNIDTLSLYKRVGIIEVRWIPNEFKYFYGSNSDEIKMILEK